MSTECEVIAVALLPPLELLWRLPVFIFTEEFLVRDAATGREKFTDVRDRSALDL